MASDFILHNLKWAFGTVVFIAVGSVALGALMSRLFRLAGQSEGEQRKAFWGFTFAGPWIIGFIIFVLGPTLASLYYSFTDYKLGSDIHWVGLDNYRKMLLVEGAHGRQFSQSMLNSFYYAIIGVPLQIGAALGMAMLLNNEIPGIRAFRTIFYLPVILAGGPALLLAWRYMLNANGGFINEALQAFAGSFSVFDYLYRLLIYLSEAFNGFFAGIVRSDPIGPLKYTLPAFLGVLLLLAVALGDWTDSKRVTAWRGAHIFGIIIVYTLASKGLMAQPIDPAWIYFAGLVLLTGILYSAWQGMPQLTRVWQAGALAGLGLCTALLVSRADFDLSESESWAYLLAIGLVAAPVLVSLAGTWTRLKFRVVGGAAALLAVILFTLITPGQLDGGRLKLVGHYLTFGSALDSTTDIDYLENVYPHATLSSLWIYGLVIAVLLGGALLNTTYPRARRTLLVGGLAFMVLFTLGSFLDARTYFRAFADIAAAEGKPAFHFALFRQATDAFPDSTRVPLWMSSELWAKPSLILITMWSSGAGMLIFLAALKGVPRSFYEAAEVDGATRVQKFMKITLPMISPAMFYNVVIGSIAALQTFDNVYILQTQTTVNSLSSAAFYLFQRTFRQLNVGEGAAMSWILVIIILTLTVLQFRYSRSWVHYEA